MNVGRAEHHFKEKGLLEDSRTDHTDQDHPVVGRHGPTSSQGSRRRVRGSAAVSPTASALQSELHPVAEMTFTNDQATIIAPGRTEFLHLDVVYAIGCAETMAVSMRSHRQRLLRPEPRQNMQLARLTEARPNGHGVAHRPSELVSHDPIMPDGPALSPNVAAAH